MTHLFRTWFFVIVSLLLWSQAVHSQHTLVIEPGWKVIYRRTGAIEPLEVRRAIVGYLGRTY